MTMYRHGDVLLIRRDAAQPEVGDPTEIVVAAGEVTGHAHRVSGPAARLSDHSTDLRDGVLRLNLPQGGTITHEEHGLIDLTPGLYEVRIQRTMTQRGTWERVRD